jgi:hypothetical protein
MSRNQKTLVTIALAFGAALNLCGCSTGSGDNNETARLAALHGSAPPPELKQKLAAAEAYRPAPPPVATPAAGT